MQQPIPSPSPSPGGVPDAAPVASRPVQYANIDGARIDDGRYTAFKARVRGLLGDERVVDDPVR
eukprot:7225308-Prymnesium_polylepis.1